MLPHYLSIGLTYKEYMHSTPRLLEAYEKAFDKKIEMFDSLAWQFCGNYVLSAISVAVEHCLAGRKAKSDYLKQPVLKEYYEDKYMTEEERKQKQLDLFVEKMKAMQANFDAIKKQGQ